ncbi:hypothetical protein [Roseibium sp. RKSG952]|uniref:hypothetical protein n=1 Tax=Roseibium sp. RKSG952 TaxID=2529384 RepID=UPI0012BBEC1B|nr:hypothetical protein [Roseibium sp. RKSG952]MTH98025.1 hypothetical protein [Roseibium sp. RKSG952]
MPCFCTVPADTLRNRFIPGIMPIFPVPPALRLAAAIPALEERLDMQIETGMNPVVLPNLDFGGGPMIQMAMTLSMMAGNFTLDDIPQLQAELEQVSNSIVSNVWPRLGWLTQLKLQPLINYAIIARLVIDLEDMGLDPLEMQAPPPTSMVNSFSFALRPPQLKMARLLGGLPPLMQMNEALNLPPLGDPGALSVLQNRLQGLASLTPPSLVIPFPILTKLALALESLMTIEEAFDDAFSPQTLRRIDAMLSVWSGFHIPIPLAALALREKLDLLPPMEDIRLGEQIAGGPGIVPLLQFSPPKLAIAPFMNVLLALQGSMQMALDMEPFDMCSMCSC